MNRKRYRMTRNRYEKSSNPCTESPKRYREAGKRSQIASKEAAGSSGGILLRAERFWVLREGCGRWPGPWGTLPHLWSRGLRPSQK